MPTTKRCLTKSHNRTKWGGMDRSKSPKRPKVIFYNTRTGRPKSPVHTMNPADIARQIEEKNKTPSEKSPEEWNHITATEVFDHSPEHFSKKNIKRRKMESERAQYMDEYNKLTEKYKNLSNKATGVHRKTRRRGHKSKKHRTRRH
jgi:hypothetical protein